MNTAIQEWTSNKVGVFVCISCVKEVVGSKSLKKKLPAVTKENKKMTKKTCLTENMEEKTKKTCKKYLIPKLGS